MRSRRSRDVRLLELYPTPVWLTDLPELSDANRRMLAHIEALHRREPGLERSNVGGWHSRDDLHRHRAFAPLRAAIRGMLRDHVAPAMRLDLKANRLMLETMWAIRNGPHAYNFVHRHPECILSGVYYLQCDPGSGSLNFHDPRSDVRMLPPPITEEVPYTVLISRHRPKVGRLVLFPAWLPHDVSPNTSDLVRVVVSFNVGYRSLDDD